MLEYKGCWITRDVGLQVILDYRDVGLQGMLDCKGCWITRDVGL